MKRTYHKRGSDHKVIERRTYNGRSLAEKLKGHKPKEVEIPKEEEKKKDKKK